MLVSPSPALGDISIRDAEPASLAALAALFRRDPITSAALSYHLERGPDPRALLQRIGTGYRLLIAEHAGEPVGTISVVFDHAYRAGEALDVAYMFDLKVEHAWRRTGLADALMQAAVAACREQLGPAAPLIMAVASDNAAGLKKVANLTRDQQSAVVPMATVRLHVLLPAVPPLALWGAGGYTLRAAQADDIEPMLALWHHLNAHRNLARAYTLERFRSWVLDTPGLTFWLACDRHQTLIAFAGIWDQSSCRRFILGEASGVYQAFRGAMALATKVGKLSPLPAPGEELPFRSVINMCAPPGATGALTAIIARALDETRAQGGLFLCWALDTTDPANAVADKFWGSRSSLQLLANEAFPPSSGPVQAEVALG